MVRQSNMNPRILCFEESEIVDFIRANQSNIFTKDYELIVAVLLKRFYEDILPGEYLIGFQLKATLTNKYAGSGNLSIDEISNLLKTRVDFEESTDIDIVIRNTTMQPGDLVFQLKRFGLGQEKDGNVEVLIKFLEKYKNYGKTDTRLVILLIKNKSVIPTKPLKDWLEKNDFPFKQVDILGIRDNSLELVQLYPKPSMQTLQVNDILFD